MNLDPGSNASRGQPWAWEAPWLAAALVLTPFAAAPLPLILGHRVQSGSILLLILTSIVYSWKRGGYGPPRPSVVHPIVLGTAFWAGAALLGLIVAMARGNDLVPAAGQFLAMVLLPMGFLAGWGLGKDPWPGLAQGALAGASVAVLIHLAYWGYQLTQGVITTRFLLPNAISLSGVALLGLLLAVALSRADSTVRSRWGKVGGGALVLFILNSGTRGLWLVTLPALVLMALIAKGCSFRRTLRVVRWAVPAFLVLGLLTAPLLLWWHQSHPVTATTAAFLPRVATGRVPAATPSDPASKALWWRPASPEDRRALGSRIPVTGGRGYRLVGRLSGHGQGVAWVNLVWLDGQQRPMSRREHVVSLANEVPVLVVGIAPVGAGGAQVSLAYAGEPEASIEISELVFEELGSPALTVTGSLLVMGLQRVWHTVAVLSGLEPPNEPSLAFRINESRHLLRQVRDSSWVGRLLGHGLGAKSPYPGFGFDGQGRWRRIGHIHYVHNFYVFALFKLGVLGLGMVTAALACWLVWSAVSARRIRGKPAGGFLAAMASAWAGYALWSLASPEILNFRNAPLWGLFLAATIRAARCGGGVLSVGSGTPHCD